MSASVAVVILNYNGTNHLREFLPSVISFSGEHEIIVIDNASTDDSVSFLKQHYPQIKIIQNPFNLGYSGGYDLGLKQLQHDYFILLNSDVETRPGWIDPCIEMMENDSAIAAVQPKIKSFLKQTHFEYAGAAGGFIDKDYYPFCRGRMFDIAEEDLGQYDTSTEIFWASGACLFIRAKAYREVGGLDHDFFAHMEEIDLCFRLQHAGYRIMYCPQSVVFHLGGGTLNYSSPNKTYLNFRNNLFLIHKNHFGSSLFLKVFRRLCLDGIASLKFIAALQLKHMWAVGRAHMAYYKAISRLKKQREVNRLLIKNNALKGVYKRSVLVSRFLRGKKKFSDLEF